MGKDERERARGGVEWSGMGWGGVEWGGVEWGEVGWGGVGWSMLYTQALLGMRPGMHVDYISQMYM